MKSGHIKTHTVDSASLQKILKSQRNHTDENLIFQQARNPIFSSSTNPFANRVLTSCNFENGRMLTTDYTEKHQKMNTQLDSNSSPRKSEDSISNDIYADMVSKLNNLNAEVASLKHKEKKYMAKISSLENEKGLLIQALEQTQKKLQDTVQKSKDDKKRMNIIIESFRQSLQSFEKPKSTKETQTGPDQSIQASPMDKSSSRGLIYAPDYTRNFEMLIEKMEEMAIHSNALIEENNKLKADLDSYKKYTDSLKGYVEHHKNQAKKQENIQTSIVEKSNAILNENTYYKDFVKSIVSIRKNEGEQSNLQKRHPQSINDRVNGIIKAVPSYLKAMSMALRETTDD